MITMFIADHKAYQGYIYMHYCYNNPVMHVFSHLLVKSVSQTQSSDPEAKVELVGADALVKPSPKRSMRYACQFFYCLGFYGDKRKMLSA